MSALTDEAVEAAAKAACEFTYPPTSPDGRVKTNRSWAETETWEQDAWRGTARAALEAAVRAESTDHAISGADIKPGMTILLTPGSKPFRVDGVEPFNKSENTFVLSTALGVAKVVSADRWYCLLGGVA